MMGFYGTGQVGTLANDQDAVAATLGDSESVVLVAASGTLKGTLAFEASVDGTNWAAIRLGPVAAPGAAAASAAVDGSGGSVTAAWSGAVGGFTSVRARLHPATSGSATVTVRTA